MSDPPGVADGNLPKRGRFGRPLLALGLGIVLALAISELMLRALDYSPAHFNPLRSFHVADPVLGYRGRPDFAGRFQRPQFDVVIEHDSRGFRKQEHQRPREGADRRVFVLGDSYAWGWGVAQGEVFTDRLSLLLPQTFVENYGLNASGTAMQALLYESEIAEHVRPGDLVVVMFFNNDFRDNVRVDRVHGEIVGGVVHTLPAPPGFLTPVASWIKRQSYSINLASYLLNQRKLGAIREEALSDAALLRGPGPKQAQVIVTEHYLRTLRLACEQRGAHFLVVWVPDDRHLAARQRGVEDSLHAAFLSVLDSVGLPHLDPTPAFMAAAENSDDPRLHLVGDGHWNAAGHEVMARALAEYVAMLP